MKIIQYKTLGAMLERGPDGKLVRKVLHGSAELPFSEDNLQQANAAALPGTVQIRSVEGQDISREEVHQRFCLQDRANGKLFEVYIENGQLMMEVL